MSQKAAVVLVQLDDDRAHAILRNMSEAEVTLIMQEVASLPAMTENIVESVAAELCEHAVSLLQVRQGGRETAARLLKDRLGAARAEEILNALDSASVDHPLAFLNQIDTGHLGSHIADEHPQTIAIVVAHLAPDNAARVIERLPEALRGEVARRVAKIEALPPSVVAKLAAELESRLSSLMGARALAEQRMDGVQTVVRILNSTDRATEKTILDDLEERDPELAESIRKGMFVFDDLLGLADADLQLVLRNVAVKTVALALKGKGANVVTRIMENLSERNGRDLQEEMEALGPQRQSLVEHAEGEIIRQALALSEAGEVNLGRGDDQLVA